MRVTGKPSALLLTPLLAVCLLVVTALSASAERIALVIGNSAYQNTVALPNPRNDAEAISAALRELGFEVFDGYDLTRAAFEDLIRAFARSADTAEAAVLYYAGHGLEVGNVNYLVPVDAAIQDETDLQFETVTLGDIMSLMERRQRTNLIFLDACRDNPMARNLTLSMGTRSVAVGRGLAPVETGIGTLIAYATQPGNVALDGEGRHSPFTEALLNHIGTPDLDVELMLRRVRRDVMEDTLGMQVPWSSSSLTGSFKFQPEPVATPVPENIPTVAEPTAEVPAPVAQAAPVAEGEAEEVAGATPAAEQGTPVAEPTVSEPAPPEAEESTQDVVIASLPDPAAEPVAPARTSPIDPRDLARQTQAALNRLGCNAGVEDGIWGRRSETALSTLSQHTDAVQIAALEPSVLLLEQLEALDGRICPLVCAVTENLVDGACVTKTCPAGQKLSSRGNCYVPKATSSAPRSSGTRRSSSCFSLNGQTYCQ